jgi:hypothetical protein
MYSSRPHPYFLNLQPISFHGGTSSGGQLGHSGATPEFLLGEPGGKDGHCPPTETLVNAAAPYGCIALNPEGELQQKEFSIPLVGIPSYSFYQVASF